MDKNTAIEMAKEAYDIQDWIIGSESGGVEGPRRLIEVTAVETEDGVRVEFDYTWPATCGLSDRIYHDLRHGKRYRKTFLVTNDEIYIEVANEDGSISLSKNVFECDDFVKEYVDEKSTDFYEKWGISA